MPTSYNGWEASKDPAAIDVDREFEVLGHRFPGGVKRGDVSTVFRYLIEQLHTRVEPLEAAASGEWGWVYKQSANSPDLISCHASATAIDYNAPLHPNRKRGTWTADQRAVIVQIIDVELEGVVRWLALKADGGSAKTTPDEMHFEIRGDAAAVARVAAKLDNEEDDMPTADEIAEAVWAKVVARQNGEEQTTAAMLALIDNRATAGAASSGKALENIGRGRWIKGSAPEIYLTSEDYSARPILIGDPPPGGMETPQQKMDRIQAAQALRDELENEQGLKVVPLPEHQNVFHLSDELLDKLLNG